jgi:hypothetical protein
VTTSDVVLLVFFVLFVAVQLVWALNRGKPRGDRRRQP